MGRNDAEFIPDILVVDSDVIAGSATSTLLRQAGYRVIATASFTEARSLNKNRCAGLLIADIRLGEFNGLHLAWERYVDHPRMPTIITHITRDPVLEEETKKVGALYLVKPVQPRELLNAVAKLLEPRPVWLPMTTGSHGELSLVR